MNKRILYRLCKHGHELSPENTLFTMTKRFQMHRVCRICAREATRNRRKFGRKITLDTDSKR